MEVDRSSRTEAAGELTGLLGRWRDGDATAYDRLIELVYPELKKLAEIQLRRSPGHLTLHTTELAHESFFKLVRLNRVEYGDRQHFFAVAARVMRQLVVDHLRSRGTSKRGGNLPFVQLDEVTEKQVPLDGSVDWLGVHEALNELEQLDEAAARIVELKFFSGLTIPEIANTVGCSEPTVKRRWRFARSWLADRLRGDED